MSLKKILSSMLILGVMAVPAIQMGCVPNDLNLIPNDQIDDTDPADQTPPPAGSQTPVLTITSLVNDITVAQGQPVLLTWQIQNLPTTPTIDVLCRATTEDTDKLLIAGLTTSNVGSLQIDTFSLVPGLKYYIKLNLKSAGAVVASAQTGGRVTIGAPKLTITSPLNDKVMLPSELMTINWTGNYLPAGSTLQTFLDSDTTYSNGNEIIVKTDSLPAGGSLGSGSISLDAMTLWNHADVKRSVPYYLGLRIVKNGQISIASYASATVKLYGGEGFDLTSPTGDVSIRAGDPVSVQWTTSSVPTNLKVKIFLADLDNEIVVPRDGIHQVSAGGAPLNTLDLPYHHRYDVMVNLLDGDTVIAVKKATGILSITNTGSTIIVTDPYNPSEPVDLDFGESYTIRWMLSNAPVNGVVDLYLDRDGDYSTTEDQIQISPNSGQTASLKEFVFTADATKFPNMTRQDYFVIAQLRVDNEFFGQSISTGKIHLDRIISISNTELESASDTVPLNLGETFTIEWSLVQEITNSRVVLYVDSDGIFTTTDDQVKITDDDGITASDIHFDFTPGTDKFMGMTGREYFVIARLIASGIFYDEAVSIGKLFINKNFAISNTELQNQEDKVYLGLGNSFTIKWNLFQDPNNGTVDLYLDADGDFDTIDDQVKISPDGGVIASDKEFTLTPDAATFTDKTDVDYFVIARLMAGADLFEQAISTGKIRIGDGGVILNIPDTDADPATDEELLVGNTLNVTWTLTGDICTKFPGKAKTLRLYIDTQPEYNAETSVEISPAEGLNACRTTKTFIVDPLNLSYAPDTSYYVIGRLSVQDQAEDEARVATSGRFIIPDKTFNVLTPELGQDIVDHFDTIKVTWEIQNLATAGKKVRILAANDQHPDGKLISPRPDSGNEYMADDDHSTEALAAVADASKLRPGTYTIHCEVFGFNAEGNEAVYAEADAGGKIIIPDGYIGTYYLSDMSNAANDSDLGAPIDGSIFNGYVLGDGVGYEVATMGDLNSDGMGDFIIFSRYGKIHNSNQSGAGYLIYGKNDFPQAVNLNNVAAVASTSPVEGTILRFPMENAANPGSDTQGRYFATAIPDVSGDGKVDMMLSCLEAAPLVIHYVNITPGYNADGQPIPGKIMTLTDHLGLSRTITPGNLATNPYATQVGNTEIAHVRNSFTLKDFNMEGTPYKLYYGVAKDIGNPQTYEGRFDLEYLATATNHRSFKPGSVITITANPVLKADLSDIDHYDITCNVKQPGSLEIEYTNVTPTADADGNPITGKKMTVSTDYTPTQYELVPSPVAREIVKKTDRLALLPDTIKITVTMDGEAPVIYDLIVDLNAIDDGVYPGVNKYKPGTIIRVRATPIYDNSDVPTAVTNYTLECSIFQPFLDPFNRRGVCYLLTSDRLSQYTNKVFDMVRVGEFHVHDTGLSGPARDQMLTADDPDTYFGSGVAVLPNLRNGSSLEMVITNPSSSVIDTLGDFSFRDSAGYGLMFGSQNRFSSLGTNIFGINTTVSSTPSTPAQVDFLGSQENAELTSVAMLSSRKSTIPGNIGFDSLVPRDFNKDGTYDMLFGAPGESSGEGAVYILPLDRFYEYHVPDNILIDLNDLNTPMNPNLTYENPISGIKITGEANDRLGEIVKAIGDFNGDGLGDFVVALPEKDSTGGAAAAGRIVIIFGKANVPPSTIDISTITSGEVGQTGLNALIFEGEAAGDNLGARICGVQDINGDGFDDILVAAPNADHNGTVDCGKVYLIYGKGNIVKKNPENNKTYIDYDGNNAADIIQPITVIGTPPFYGAVFVGEAAGDQLQTMSNAGDVNGDGIGDFLLGAPFADVVSINGVTYENAGRAYLIRGRMFTWPVNP